MNFLRWGFLFAGILVVIACSNQKPNSKSDSLSGKLHIIHAGSMSVPVKQIVDSFIQKYPDVDVLTEAWGSKAGARRITDLGHVCDVYISADYRIIDKMLIPDFADWNIKFAGNEMAIVYTPKSHYASSINADNWCHILQKNDVIFARSDPNSDPCGARAVIVSELAEKYYKISGFKRFILTNHTNFIRPKETDLIALLEQGAVDYLFLYRSVAIQHNLLYVELPDEVNLNNNDLDSLYAQATVEVIGSKPGETLIEHGESMVYGITIPNSTQNKLAAEAFVTFFLEKDNGQNIIVRNGQTSLVPLKTSTYSKVPESLQAFCKQ
jgi:molybdate/tungstate transport system substrate-binding protein